MEGQLNDGQISEFREAFRLHDKDGNDLEGKRLATCGKEMGVDLLEVGVHVRKVVMFSARKSYRLVCNHPFLLGILCFSIFMYRSFPFLFSLLVSGSPVFICTAVLLGTLLSFGQPNIPEINEEEKITHEVVALRTGVQRDATVVEENEGYTVDRYTDVRRDEVEQTNEEASSGAKKIEVHRDGGYHETLPLLEEMSREIHHENRDIHEADGELHDSGFQWKNKLKEERHGDVEFVENHYSPIAKVDDEDHEFEDDKSTTNSFSSEKVNINSPPGSPWKQVEERDVGEEQEQEEHGGSDSGSDHAESSSPDASMADIIPMLDELSPLLDGDAPQPTHFLHEGSDAGSERSAKSQSSNESDGDSENQDELEAADEDNDGEDEEETQGDKDGSTKSVINWTEEDQKNLMDLGTSELERNQRLENLIARRRARKSMKTIAEKNLIDFDTFDLPFTVAPISTMRRNPFDLPHDSYDSMGLPPIPGSAPSILLPRQNPFDLPYDSSEEKPDLVGDGFQEEFVTLQPREPFFRRHESFNVGPSCFGPSKQDRQDTKFRPYFVPERMASEGTSYSPLRRQSSEISDSKASSVPETESVGSAGEMEEKNSTEEDNSQETQLIPTLEHSFDGEMEEKNYYEEDMSLESELISKTEHASDVDLEGKNLIKDEVPEEPGVSSKMEHVSNHVRHGSQSSEEIDSSGSSEAEEVEVEVNELKNQMGNAGNYEVDTEFGIPDNTYEIDLSSHGSSLANPVELNVTEISSHAESVEHRYNRSSSSSSLAEESERIYSAKEGEGSLDLDESRVNILEPGIFTQPSAEESHFNITSTWEPLYDSIPTEVGKTSSSEWLPTDNQYANEEKYLSHSLEEIPFSDKSRNYTPSSEHHEVGEPSTIIPGSIEEVRTTGNMAVSDVSEVDYRVSPYVNSPTVPGSISLPYEVHETEGGDSLSKQKGKVINEAKIDRRLEVLETNFLTESSAYYLQNTIEDADNIKEIDEGLLSELDTVGDFSIQEPRPNLNEFEKHRDVQGQSFFMLQDAETSSTGFVERNFTSVRGTETVMHIANVHETRLGEIDAHGGEEVKSLSEYSVSGTNSFEHSGFGRVVSDVKIQDSDYPKLTMQNLSAKEIESELAKSSSEKDFDVKEINLGVPLAEVYLTEDTASIYGGDESASFETCAKVGASEKTHLSQVEVKTNSEMPVLEVQTIQDIHSAFKWIDAEFTAEEPVVDPRHPNLGSEETVIKCSKQEDIAEAKGELTVHEARPVQDVEVNHKQLHEENVQENDPLESVMGVPNVLEAFSKECISESPVEESLSPEDINLTLKHDAEGDVTKLIEKNSGDKTGQLEAEEGSCFKEKGSSMEASTVANDKPERQPETPELARSTYDGKGKEENILPKSGSVSSSSSASSTSDSDTESEGRGR